MIILNIFLCLDYYIIDANDIIFRNFIINIFYFKLFIILYKEEEEEEEIQKLLSYFFFFF